MTIQEVCRELDMNEITIKKAFPRTQRNLAKRGIKLTRRKIKGWEYDYEIEYIKEEEL